MDQGLVIDITREAIMLMIQLATPVMLIGLVVGVVIALIQALTQIQEMTLSFVPKIIAIYLAIFFLLPGMAQSLVTFTESLADRIAGMG